MRTSRSPGADCVSATTTEPRLEARNELQAIFDELGADHPLTKTDRKRLADELH